MEKRYIAPESVSVEIFTEQMLAGSMTVSNKDVDFQMSHRKDMWGNEGMWNQ